MTQFPPTALVRTLFNPLTITSLIVFPPEVGSKWKEQETEKLIDLVKKHAVVVDGREKHIWNAVARELATGRTEQACEARYGYVRSKGGCGGSQSLKADLDPNRESGFITASFDR